MLVGDSSGNLDGQQVDRDWLLRLDFSEGFLPEHGCDNERRCAEDRK